MKKQLIKVLSFILIILFVTLTPISSYIGIYNNVYASVALTGLGLKLVAVILASMGVLKFVNENIGLDEFYQGLLDFVEMVKGVTEFPQLLIEVATDAIVYGTKAKINSVAGYIREYYNMLVDTLVPDEPLVPTLPGAKAVSEYEYIGERFYIDKTEKIINIGNGYTFKYKIEALSGVRNNFKLTGKLYYLENRVPSYDFNISAFNELQIAAGSDNINLRGKLQITDNLIVFNWLLINYTTNKTYEGLHTKEVEPLVGLVELPPLTEVDYNMPIALSVPINLTFPWDFGLNIPDVIGLTVEQVLEEVSNISLETFIDRLLDLPKSAIDSLVQPGLEVAGDGTVTGVRETVVEEVLEETKTQTDILTSIRDKIDVIIGKLDKFFDPEENPNNNDNDNGIDWGNFKGLFDIFWIFYYLIILAIIILLKFFNVIMSLLDIPANTALFDSYPTMLDGLNYIKNIKVGGFNVTLQTIFEYMFTIFFFLYIVTTLQKLYHSFLGIERQSIKEEEIRNKNIDNMFNK